MWSGMCDVRGPRFWNTQLTGTSLCLFRQWREPLFSPSSPPSWDLCSSDTTSVWSTHHRRSGNDWKHTRTHSNTGTQGYFLAGITSLNAVFTLTVRWRQTVFHVDMFKTQTWQTETIPGMRRHDADQDISVLFTTSVDLMGLFAARLESCWWAPAKISMDAAVILENATKSCVTKLFYSKNCIEMLFVVFNYLV